MLSDLDAASTALLCDRALRRQIDRCISRALLDGEYARLLLAAPTLVLEEYNCLPQDYLSLQSINAGSLFEFAQQAQALFWFRSPRPASSGADGTTRSRSRRSWATLPVGTAAG